MTVTFFGGPSDGDTMELTRDEIVRHTAPNGTGLAFIMEPHGEPIGGKHYALCKCPVGPLPLHLHWHERPWLTDDVERSAT
jgi:hypothetical protein